MGLTADTINQTAARGIGLVGLLLKDVTPDTFARLPQKDGQFVQTNHPAFILGHLSLYPERVFQLAGEDSTPAALPDGYEALFVPGAQCQDDPSGSIYPAMPDLVQNFQRTYGAALQLIASWDDDRLGAKHQGEERYQNMFPTLGIAANFLVNSHVMMHLGQFSAWRRCMGLGSAM